MTIKQLLQEANAIQIGIDATDWRQVIALAAEPLVSGGYLDASYPDAVIANTLAHGAYYVFEEGIAIPHARPDAGVIRDCFSMILLNEPISFEGSDKADIVIMFGARDSNAHIEEGSARLCRCWKMRKRWSGYVRPAVSRRSSISYDAKHPPQTRGAG